MTGDTKYARRVAILNDLQAGRILLLIAHVDVAGEGITMTAVRFAYVWSFTYVPSQLTQIAAQFVRIGQRFRVSIFVLVSNSMVEFNKV